MIRGRVLAVGGVVLLVVLASVDALLLMEPSSAVRASSLLTFFVGSARAEKPFGDSPIFKMGATCDHLVRAGGTDQWTVVATAAGGPPALRVSGLPAYGALNDDGKGTGTLVFSPPIDTAGADLSLSINASFGGASTTISCTERVLAAPRNPPSATLSISPSSGRFPLTVTADASGSAGRDGIKLDNYRFDFGDGTLVGPQSSPTATHTYFFTGNYSVSVVVTDSAGLASRASAAVVVTLPPLPPPPPSPAATPSPSLPPSPTPTPTPTPPLQIP